MVKKQRRKFEIGFKKQLVTQIEIGQITAMEAARTHSISPTVIKQFQTRELSEGPTGREKALMKEMEQYKKLLAEAHREIDLLKKTKGTKAKTYKTQYLCDNRSGFASIKKGCEQMNLARSTYYYQVRNKKKALEREKQDADLKDLIDDIHIDFPYYGYRSLHEELLRRP